MDRFPHLEDIHALDYSPFDDVDVTEATQDGLLEIGIKPETLADTQMEGLLEMYNSPNEGFFGAEWMEQTDFVFPDDTSILDLPLHLEEDFAFSSPSMPPLTTITPNLVGEHKEEEVGDLGHVFANEFLHSSNKESVLKLDTPPSSPQPLQDQVAPGVDSENNSTLQALKSASVEFLQSLSSDDVESVLSSACSSSTSPSPAPSPSSPTTVDISSLYTVSGLFSFSSKDLYKVVENTDKSRATPYSRPHKTPKSCSKSKGRRQTASISPNPTELELELMSKKDRKKLQNKNAAIRYRMKKKAESDQQKTEVEELESVNISLREKCEELQREVKCMKDLISDIRKARGQPPLPLTALY